MSAVTAYYYFLSTLFCPSSLCTPRIRIVLLCTPLYCVHTADAPVIACIYVLQSARGGAAFRIIIIF